MEAQCWDGSKIKTSTIIDERSPLIKPSPECEDGAIKEKKCDDGKVITTHECVNGYWEKTNEKCDDNGDEDECEEGDLIFQPCDIGVVVSHICVDGKWEETGAECPERNPPEQTMFEPERACSLRLKPQQKMRSHWITVAISRVLTPKPAKGLLLVSRAGHLVRPVFFWLERNF